MILYNFNFLKCRWYFDSKSWGNTPEDMGQVHMIAVSQMLLFS